MSDPQIFADCIDELSTKVEEGARASIGNVDRFIEPAKGTLRRATARRHHLVFGRRGSGKSSLLMKAASDLEGDHPIAFVDLEPFKGHHYPDVLISVLLVTFRKYGQWLDSHKPSLFERLQFWKRDRPDRRAVQSLLSKATQELEKELFSEDDASIVTTTNDSNSSEKSSGRNSSLSVGHKVATASVEQQLATKVGSRSSSEVTEENRRSKQDFLHRKILEYQAIFRSLGEIGDATYLFLDDLYHLRRSDQANVLDYFHRISKNNSLWLKTGTIKNRSSWYVHGPQPVGLKIGDDADDINLDLTLEKFSSSRDFLLRILNSYGEEVSAPKVEEFLSDGGINRLVIASGGVTRDFLGIFRRAIDEARERLTRDPDHPRGEKIGAEDVNVASGNYGDTKKEEFQRDTLDDRVQLERVFEKVRLFCLSRNKANVFLIDQDAHDPAYDLIQELIDLRLLHHVRSRVTVGSKPGKIYRALLLDISQYTGERRRKGIKMIEFWRPQDKDVLRRPQYILDPATSVEAVRRDIRQRKAKGPNEDDELDGQLHMFPRD